MQINTRKTGPARFKPTKRELDGLAAAADLAAFVARNAAEAEPLHDVALKAAQGVEELMGMRSFVRV